MNAQDQALVDNICEDFFLSDLVRTASWEQIQQQIKDRYQTDQDGELPDGYWDDLNAAVDHLLRKAIELNQPVQAAA
jgi:hypothetical protein